MAPEPINIFSHKIDPAGVVEVVRKLACEIQLDGTPRDWTTLVAFGNKKLLRGRPRLVIGHDVDYYDNEDWISQVVGMRNYFAGFPDVAGKDEILKAIMTFRFSLAFPEADVDIDSNDERLKWIFAICKHLDGVLFTPSSLRDCEGRILIDGGGSVDPQAVLCAIPEIAFWEAPLDEEDDEEEPDPPTAQRVAMRALALSAICNRGLIENESEEMDDPEGTRQGMLEWLEAAGASDELEPEEWKILQRRLGTLESQSAINSAWRLEGLAVLLWALGVYELPAHDELVTPADLFEAVSIFDAEESRKFLQNTKLRPPEELAAYQTYILMMNWRLTDYRIRPQSMNFVEFSKDCWIGSFDLGPFEIVDHDVAIGGEPIDKADPDLVGLCQSITKERHQAANWLMGEHRLYSQVETNT